MRRESPPPSGGALPNLLILGFPKCGTHALLHNLGLHPEVHFCPDELGWFGNPRKSLEKYRSHFLPEARYNLEKSPYYVLRESAMRQIAELAPEAKLIVCLRHPVQFAHSFYNFRVFEFARGYAPGFDPARYRFEDIVLDELEVKGFHIRQACYLNHIEKNVLAHFPRRQVHFVIQERMHAAMAAEMDRVFAFLDLESANLPFGEKLRQHDEHHRYPTIDYGTGRYRLALAKLFELYEPWNAKLFEFLGAEIPEWKPFDAMYRSLLDSR